MFDPLLNLFNPYEEEKPDSVRAFEAHLARQPLQPFDPEKLARRAAEWQIIGNELYQRSRRCYWASMVFCTLALVGLVMLVAGLARWHWVAPFGLLIFVGGMGLGNHWRDKWQRCRKQSDYWAEQARELWAGLAEESEGGPDGT